MMDKKTSKKSNNMMDIICSYMFVYLFGMLLFFFFVRVDKK